MTYAKVSQIIFKNKQKIPWNDVEQYLKKYVGKSFVVKEYGDIIHIAGELKAKANAGQVIEEMIENAQNRRWMDNKNEKHKKKASGIGIDMMWHSPYLYMMPEPCGGMRIRQQQLSELIMISFTYMISSI